MNDDGRVPESTPDPAPVGRVRIRVVAGLLVLAAMIALVVFLVTSLPR